MELGVSLANVCLGDPALLQGSVLAAESKETRIARAVAISDRLVAAHGRDPNAWLAHYEIASYKDRNFSDADLERAIALAPDSPIVLKQVGIHFLNRAKSVVLLAGDSRKNAWLDRAEECLRSVIRTGATPDPSVYVALGEVFQERGEIESALEIWEEGSERCKRGITTDIQLNIVQLLLRMNRLDEAEHQLALMDAAIRRDSNSMPNDNLGTANRLAKQFWANYYLARGDYQPAVLAMEQVVYGAKEMNSLNQAEASAFLGSCFMKLGQWDRAAASFEHSISILPGSPEYHREAAGAWFAAQRFSESLKQLQTIENKTAFDWIQIAEVILDLQRGITAEPSLWLLFDKAMSEARRLMPNDPKLSTKPWTLDIFKIDASLLRRINKDRSQAIENSATELIALCEAHPNSVELKRFAIRRLRSWGNADAVNQLLDSLKRTTSKDIESLLVQADFLLQEGLKQDALRILEERLQEEPSNERVKQVILNVNSATNDWSTNLESLKNLRGNKLPGLRHHYELALDAPVVAYESDLQRPEVLKKQVDVWCSRLEQIENLLKELEGDDGSEWRYVRGRRLLAAGSVETNFDFSELADLAGSLDRKRPQWASTHILLGLLAERQGNLLQAIRELNRAVVYGTHELVVFEKLTELMYRQGMLSEANIVLDKLGDLSNQSRRLSSLAMELAGGAERDQLAVANSGVLARPNDAMAWVWLAEVTEVHSRNAVDSVRASELEKAEQAFKKANELTQDKDLRIKNAQFNFYRSLGRYEEAEAVLEALQNGDGMDEAVRYRSMAQMHLSLNRYERAIECFRESISRGADPIEVGNRISQLWLSLGNRDQAIKQLEEVLESQPKDSSTRRRLAALLASRDTSSDWERVEELLSPTRTENTPDDVRMQVLLLSRKGTLADLKKAQYLLELIVEDPSNRTDEDRFQLASLYLRSERLIVKNNGESSESKELLDAAGRLLKMSCTGSQPSPEYIYTYADFLLKQDRYYDALEEYERLAVLDRDGFSTALLKARLDMANGKEDQAKGSIMGWLEARLLPLAKDSDVAKRAIPMVQAGQALLAIQLPKDAEKLLREAYQWDPLAARDYVKNLLKTDDTVVRQMAMEFLPKRVQEAKTNEFAIMLAGILKTGEADTKLMASAEEVLSQMESVSTADPQLLRSLADLWLWQGKDRQAAETFRRIIELRPNDIIAMNNLANLLAEQPNGTEEALSYIDRAIELAGEKPVLLDSKGTVLSLGGRYAEAVEILKKADTNGQSDPRIQLHLYVALSRAERNDEAEVIRRRIDLALLQKYPLTRTDQAELEKLVDTARK